METDNLINNAKASTEWLKAHGFYEPETRNKRRSLVKDLYSWTSPVTTTGDMATMVIDASYTPRMTWMLLLGVMTGRRLTVLESVSMPNVAEAYSALKAKIDRRHESIISQM